MSSPIHYASIAACIFALVSAGPAHASIPVTTGETDSGEPVFSVVIVEPLTGAMFVGTPNATVPVAIEYEGFAGSSVHLDVDGKGAGSCPNDGPCTLDIDLAPGMHTLVAIGDEITIITSDPVVIEVVELANPTSDGSESATSDPTGDPTSTSGDTDATTATTDDTTDGTSDGAATSGGDSGGDKGCGCTTGTGVPDLLGLAAFALLAPWRRRRNRHS